MNKLSIRWKLSLLFAAALALILIAFGATLIFMTRQQLLNRTDAALREELREIVLELTLHESLDEFQRSADSRFFHHDIYDFVVTDNRQKAVFLSAGITERDGSEFSHSSPDGSPKFETRTLSNGNVVRYTKEPVNAPFGPHQVFAVTSLQPLLVEIQTLEFVAAGLLPLALTLTVALGYVLAGKALAPVTSICEVANSITIDSLDRRIQVPNPHDEMGHLAGTVNSLICRLEHAVTEIRRFTADASHELRTPLAALKLEAELALRADRSPRQYQDALRVIVEETNRLCRLADQLLNLSRNDAGIVPDCAEWFPLHVLLEDVMQQMQSFAVERSIRLSGGNIEPCEVRGSDLQVRQVFVNLVENALKFTQAGGTVMVCCHYESGSVVCSVQDDGCGISPEHLPKVLQRFFRTDPSRNCESGGAGLGLSIADGHVKSHGGTISIESRVGRGTTVTVTLPARPVSSSGNNAAVHLEFSTKKSMEFIS
ncbi:MAG: HAMP domain-containing histidine kinase [Planctomycetaceae bacterium]|nr:HAMP domain-containing histidine kinase [Planctomycetaceae bacterium]